MYLVIDTVPDGAKAAKVYAEFVRSAFIPAETTTRDGKAFVVWESSYRPPALDCRDIQPVSKAVLGKVYQ